MAWGGDKRLTWQATEEATTFWPEWLADEFPQLEFWTIGYEAAPSAWLGTAMPLGDRARNILDLLHGEGIGLRPIVFVCHSLGGLVVKQMLQAASTYGDTNWNKIADQTKGILFLATPHSGSGLADFLTTLKQIYLPGYLAAPMRFMRLNKPIAELQAHAGPLRELNLWYRNNAERLGIRTKALYETQDTLGMVRVVNESSSDAGLGNPVPIDADHFSICKPLSPEAQVFKTARQFIEDCLQQRSIGRKTGPGVGTLPVGGNEKTGGGKTTFFSRVALGLRKYRKSLLAIALVLSIAAFAIYVPQRQSPLELLAQDLRKMQVEVSTENDDELSLSFPDSTTNTQLRLAIHRLESFVNSTPLAVSVDISSKEITDIGSLKSIPTLRALSIGGSKVRNLDPISEMRTLERLEAAFSDLVDIRPLSSLSNLKVLHLDVKAETDLSPLANLRALKELMLLGNSNEPPTDDRSLNLEALQNLKDLESLSVTRVPLVDLSPIGKMDNLARLNLSTTYVEDIVPLSGLNYLETLNLEKSSVLDLSPLAKLANLKDLDLGHAPIEDLTPLAQLTGLTKLNLWGTKVSSLTPIAQLQNLTRLTLAYTSVKDISPLRGLIHLENLDIKHTKVSQLDPVGQLTSLQGIDLSETNVIDLSPIRELTELRFFRADSCKAKDIAPLSALSNLESFEMRGGSIKSLKPLEQMPFLKMINVFLSDIGALPALNSLGSLETLDLSSTPVSDLSPLVADGPPPNLKVLNLRRTKVRDLTAVEKLTSLIELNVEDAQVADISPISSLHNLKFLLISDNRIGDLSPLANLRTLEAIYASNTLVTDISALHGLPLLKTVEVSNSSGTPIAGADIYRQ